MPIEVLTVLTTTAFCIFFYPPPTSLCNNGQLYNEDFVWEKRKNILYRSTP